MQQSLAREPELPRSPGMRILRREEAQSWIDGYQFLAEARRRAEALARDAQTAHDDAKQRGYEDGRKAGDLEAARLIGETQRSVDRYLASIDSQIADLALAIVQQVLGAFDDAELVTRAARQALTAFRRDKQVTIRVAPELRDRVQQALTAGTADEIGRPFLVVEADPQLALRSCTIVSEFSVVNAGLDDQLDIVRRMLGTGARDASP